MLPFPDRPIGKRLFCSPNQAFSNSANQVSMLRCSCFRSSIASGGPPRRRGLARFLVVTLFVLLVGDLRRAFAIAVSPCLHSASSLR